MIVMALMASQNLLRSQGLRLESNRPQPRPTIRDNRLQQPQAAETAEALDPAESPGRAVGQLGPGRSRSRSIATTMVQSPSSRCSISRSHSVSTTMVRSPIGRCISRSRSLSATMVRSPESRCRSRSRSLVAQQRLCSGHHTIARSPLPWKPYLEASNVTSSPGIESSSDVAKLHGRMPVRVCCESLGVVQGDIPCAEQRSSATSSAFYSACYTALQLASVIRLHCARCQAHFQMIPCLG